MYEIEHEMVQEIVHELAHRRLHFVLLFLVLRAVFSVVCAGMISLIEFPGINTYSFCPTFSALVGLMVTVRLSMSVAA